MAAMDSTRYPRPDESGQRIHSSWRGLVSAFVAPLMLVAIGGLTMAARGFHPIAAALLAAGIALELASLVDYPWSTSFDVAGVSRRCALRRHRLRWPEIRQITRASGSLLRRTPGGLAAARGRRRYLLCDQPESRDEFDGLVARIRSWSPATEIAAIRPPERTPPTWLYRRRRHSPSP